MKDSVVVVGSINVDQVLQIDRHPSPGETIAAGDPAYLPGGKGANQAVAAARRGAAVSLVGAVGQDDAAVALSALGASGVNLDHVRQLPGSTGLAVIMVAASGENTVTVSPGANARVDAHLVDAARDAIGASKVCVLQGEIPMEATDRASSIAASHGARVVLNAAPSGDFSPMTLRAADPLVVNEHEAAAALDLLGGDAPAGDDDADIVATARAITAALLDRGVPSVLTTLGAAGVIGGESADGLWHEPARRVTPVDTTGAGDAFIGALAAELASGSGLRDAAKVANRVAAFSVQRHGTQGSYPDLTEELP
ncbi:ribokinase [Demequina sp.]|uniref:ribokinase n=1 Tax=Demequina sp. TaxID=2050685 RepID=UPI0025C0ACF5|nr:ribokinase [Demequina sp.]